MGKKTIGRGKTLRGWGDNEVINIDPNYFKKLIYCLEDDDFMMVFENKSDYRDYVNKGANYSLNGFIGTGRSKQNASNIDKIFEAIKKYGTNATMVSIK